LIYIWDPHVEWYGSDLEAKAGDDVTETAWVRPAQFDDYELWDEARRIIRAAMSLLPP